jgi:hypothetical protein
LASTRTIVGGLAAALCVAFLTGEAVIRVVRPAPRTQVIRPGHFYELSDHDGIPVWSWPDHDEEPAHIRRHGLDCRDDADIKIVVAGDSIFHGIGVPVEKTSAWQLTARINERFPGKRACVINIAEPAHSLYVQAPLIHGLLDDLQPDVLILELWGGLPRTPTRFDDTIYYFQGATLDANGLPDLFGIPAVAHAALWRRSQLWEYVHLAMLPPPSRSVDSEKQAWKVLDDLHAHAARAGTQTVRVLPSFLNRPFADQVLLPELFGMDWYLRWEQERELSSVKLWDALSHLDPLTLGIDACHFNETGHIALTQVFEDAVVPLIDVGERED